MRLADVDTLLKEAMKDGAYGYVDVWQIENAPTVEAITVEWMKSWAMKNWVKTGKNEFDIIVSKLIDDWLEEKENG